MMAGEAGVPGQDIQQSVCLSVIASALLVFAMDSEENVREGDVMAKICELPSPLPVC